MTNAKGKVKTAAAVTSVLAVSGGVATAFHLHQDGLRNSAEAASQDSNTLAAAAAATRSRPRAGTTAANRDLQRPDAGPVHDPERPGRPRRRRDEPDPAAGSPDAHRPSGRCDLFDQPSTSVTSTPLTSHADQTTPTTTASHHHADPHQTTTTSSAPSSCPRPPRRAWAYNATPAQAKAIAESVVPSSQFLCFSNIIERESSWNLHATNPSSGAYGLGQSLPGYKMASMGSDWRNSALIQIKWALSYMTGRYGSPCAAWAFWQAHDWY